MKDPKVQVAAIGLAGENRVYMASIEQGRSSASRLGLGAVMGDKGLKAIAVRATKDINVAKPAEYLKLCTEVLEYIKIRAPNLVPEVMPILAGLGSPQAMAHYDEKWHTENFSWGNARVGRKEFWTNEIEEKWKGSLETARKRLISCYNCPMKCGAIISRSNPGTTPAAARLSNRSPTPAAVAGRSGYRPTAADRTKHEAPELAPRGLLWQASSLQSLTCPYPCGSA